MKEKIAFIGGGIIGAGLATNALISGYNVWIWVMPNENELTYKRVNDVLDSLLENKVINAKEKDEAVKRLSVTNSIEEAAKDAAFVQEAVIENVEIKRNTIAQIEAVIEDDVVIASTTSTISATSLQEGAKCPERIVIGHPFNPAYLLPLVEVCVGDKTSEETIEKARAFYKAFGKEPVVCRKDIPGFIVNRASRALLNDARETVASGACTAEDYDKALMYGPGLRMAVTGQLLTIDLGTAGGLRNNAAKYNRKMEPYELIVADSVDEEIAARDASIGNNREDICKWRDRMIVEILRLHGKYQEEK